MNKQFRKYFTLEEARELLPQLRKRFACVHTARDQMRELDFELGQILLQSGGDVGGPKPKKLARAMGELYDEMLILSRLGVQVKDLERGLVDFPSWREGREVFLCWELDEDDIAYWHDLETGYTGRRKL